jgi:pumilio RNA-binding family
MKENIKDYMNDAFGNYLVQRIIENLDLEQLKELLKVIEPEFYTLGSSPHGTRCIQKIIDCIIENKELIQRFNKIFEKNSIKLMKDINGNHIIIKYVNTLLSPTNDFIFHQLSYNLTEICTDKHGCCVIQKCIEYATDYQKVILIFNYFFRKY